MTTAAARNEAPSSDLLSTYRRREISGFDELLDGGGGLRDHWRLLLDGLQGLSGAERELRTARLARRVRETGIAYDIFADPHTSAQRWSLDLLPIVISADEWRWLERALMQRARLFDSLLNDLYGEQRLLREGLIPSELVFSDPAYLLPCNGILPRAGGLRFYAADLARGDDGKWRVIDNHTETLAGIGFTLANRVVHTHVSGDIFNDCNARRLAPYFQELQTTLTLHSGRENARIALLTPGPHHEDYFSHAYLARYLGYLLVEGHDLKTRNGQVYLKTLEGLREIDLIIRCVEGRSCDPLELDPTGLVGPPGLLRVCRRSPHVIANAIGTALAQNRGLGPYLPGLAHHILDEDLELVDAPRLWLGSPEARHELFANPDHFTIRKAQEGTGRPGQAALGWEARALSTPEREKMKREVALHGATLVAEEKIGFSSAPVLRADGLVPKPFAVRFYVSRTESGYQVMLGGLAMSIDPKRAVALSAPDGQTRDVWVLGEGEQAPHISLWRPTFAAARVDRSQRVIQSRVADDLFWLGRYCERADWTMRVLRGALRRVEEDSGPDTGRRAARKCLEVLLGKDLSAVTGSRKTPPDEEIERLCARLIASGLGSRTLERTLDGLYRVAHLARDRLSLEAWQTLSKFRSGETWRQTLNSARPVEVLDILDEGLATLAAFNGFMHENMTRNYGWSFLDMGRRIERAQNLAEAVLTLFIPVSPDPEETSSSLLLLLELADSFITYRSRYRLDPMLPLVLDLLLLDETNPRSLAFQLSAIARHLESLPDSHQGSALPEDRRLILALLTSIRLADIEAMAREENGAMLERLLMDQLDMLPELSNEISRHYFNVMDEAPHRAHTRVGPLP
ncbi:MAG: circularly permuted type 2 ATP-grasp protein [Proteobacteria bacterium]|nr:circularly permuted type 2 ATP-grasp protein [Pseudomonadota bacterium]